MWVIRGVTETDFETEAPLYWNNRHGWVDRAWADAFTDDEHATLTLPLGGQWERAK